MAGSLSTDCFAKPLRVYDLQKRFTAEIAEFTEITEDVFSAFPVFTGMTAGVSDCVTRVSITVMNDLSRSLSTDF